VAKNNDGEKQEAVSHTGESGQGVHLVINPYQPHVYIDGAVLNPSGGMMELLLMKADLTTETKEGNHRTNAVHGRYIMQLEAFRRIAALFNDQCERLNDDGDNTD